MINFIAKAAEFALGLARAVVQAAMEWIVENVIEPMMEAFQTFVSWVLDLIEQVLQFALDLFLRPILDMKSSWAHAAALNLGKVEEASQSGGGEVEAGMLVDGLFTGPFPQFVFSLSSALVVALGVLGFIASVTPTGAAISVVKDVLTGIIKTATKHWVATTVAVSLLVEWALSAAGAPELPLLIAGPLEVIWDFTMVLYALKTNAPWIADAVALGLNFVGTLFVFEVLPLMQWVGSKVLAAAIGTGVAAAGLALALWGKDIPGALGQVDEFLEAATLGFDLEVLGESIAECVSEQQC
jgi:hypothetical protein